VKDEGEGEVWVEGGGGEGGEEGGVWKKRRKRPRFLQDMDLSNDGTNGEFIPPLSRSLVTRAKNRTFVFRRKCQPTLTQMVGSDTSEDDGDNEKETESGIEVFASDEVEPSTICIDDDDEEEEDQQQQQQQQQQHDHSDTYTGVEGNEVSLAFDAEAGKTDGIVIEAVSDEDVAVETNTNENSNDSGSVMIDLEKASRGRGGEKAAFW